ncbi:hypothetical protein CRG98_021463 [Punica granatum]|uniref:Uncharacterized protein n=1 Tax=Punica granatum TaxID=22663 RepID=A0A2I0JQF0_PUNGR|nr:hypothetical protein CRG98_021463 [Punica granatum]
MAYVEGDLDWMCELQLDITQELDRSNGFISGDSFSRASVARPHRKVDTLKPRCIGARTRAPTRLHFWCAQLCDTCIADVGVYLLSGTRVSRTQGIGSTIGSIPGGELELEEAWIGPLSRAMMIRLGVKPTSLGRKDFVMRIVSTMMGLKHTSSKVGFVKRELMHKISEAYMFRVDQSR